MVPIDPHPKNCYAHVLFSLSIKSLLWSPSSSSSIKITVRYQCFQRFSVPGFLPYSPRAIQTRVATITVTAGIATEVQNIWR